MNKKSALFFAGAILICACVIAATQEKPKPSGPSAPKTAQVNINVKSGAANPRKTSHLSPGTDVVFKADKNCTLTFTNPGTFGMPTVDLLKDQPKQLKIVGSTGTEYCVVGAPCPPTRGNPNEIVVP